MIGSCWESSESRSSSAARLAVLPGDQLWRVVNGPEEWFPQLQVRLGLVGSCDVDDRFESAIPRG